MLKMFFGDGLIGLRSSDPPDATLDVTLFIPSRLFVNHFNTVSMRPRLQKEAGRTYFVLERRETKEVPVGRFNDNKGCRQPTAYSRILICHLIIAGIKVSLASQRELAAWNSTHNGRNRLNCLIHLS